MNEVTTSIKTIPKNPSKHASKQSPVPLTEDAVSSKSIT